MNKVTAVIDPARLDEVKGAPCTWGVTGLTVAEVKGYARQRGHGAHYRGAEYDVEFVPKVALEVVVPSPLLPRVLDLVTRAARTGKIGDGKIFVTTITEAIRIRTEEKGVEAV